MAPRIRRLLRNHPVMALAIFSLLFLFFSLTMLPHFPQLVELIYARRLYVLIVKILSPLAAAISFSLSEIFLYLGIFSVAFWGIRGILHRRFVRTVLELCAGVVFLLLWFYLAWGFNYLRPKIEQQLQLAAVEPDSLALRENFLWCIERTNAAWQPVAPWNVQHLDQEIERGYAEVFAELNLPPVSGKWPPKFLLMPQLLDYTLTSGIFGPLFHEVHLNAHLLPVEMPFVLAHEKAHGRGFARESEASFIALLVCLRSTNTAVQYSAYFSLLGRFRARYRQYADYDSLQQFIRPEIDADFEQVWRRMEQYLGPLAELAQKSYDFYLRANQVEGGLENYSDVVDVVIRWRESKVRETN
ncbi:MAG: DUF3810 domain-containing protein [candidate division KSB1 bacterium]|nr:DUF3810 domain-containing protein [candidate division KSB1 bacterium]MDZ7366124.1 DUF3810 domain-containing protein [candidate division KSB1 bacterium]MDZ7404234.1 DUF3810 domain-containing protein [candidate division KSB1 bacterium]